MNAHTMNAHTKFQIAMSLLIAAFLILWPLVAGAQTRWDYCYLIPHGTVCVAKAQKVKKITCDWGYQPRFDKTPRCVAMEVVP